MNSSSIIINLLEEYISSNFRQKIYTINIDPKGIISDHENLLSYRKEINWVKSKSDNLNSIVIVNYDSIRFIRYPFLDIEISIHNNEINVSGDDKGIIALFQRVLPSTIRHYSDLY